MYPRPIATRLIIAIAALLVAVYSVAVGEWSGLAAVAVTCAANFTCSSQSPYLWPPNHRLGGTDPSAQSPSVAEQATQRDSVTLTSSL